MTWGARSSASMLEYHLALQLYRPLHVIDIFNFRYRNNKCRRHLSAYFRVFILGLQGRKMVRNALKEWIYLQGPRCLLQLYHLLDTSWYQLTAPCLALQYSLPMTTMRKNPSVLVVWSFRYNMSFLSWVSSDFIDCKACCMTICPHRVMLFVFVHPGFIFRMGGDQL